MPPSTSRSQRTRRDSRKDLAAPPMEEDSSPSRPAKRRKKVPQNEAPDDDQLVSQITQQLRTGDPPVQASKDHANSIHEANPDGVKAYAKVAAHDWTYYITKLAVNIGRAPDGIAGGGNPESSRAGNETEEDYDKDQVHIDLSPGKIVSRNHAVIFFDSKEERWLLEVKGRNGVKIDGEPHKPQDKPHFLSSGEVLEIGNVEMMFVLPSEISPLHIHPKYLERCGLNAADTPQARQPRPLAPAQVESKRPGTPPQSTQLLNATSATKSPAVSTPAPVMVGANGVDLGNDENQHIKPQYSYAQMITQAILNAPGGKLTLSGIYEFIMTRYSYYRHQQAAGWQNSIRHNLSLNKAFDKVARSTTEPGKGMKWQIVPEAKEEMVKNAWRIGRGGHRGSSAPSSPNQLNYITQGPRDMAARGSPSVRKRRGSLLVSPSPGSSLAMTQSTPDRPTERAQGRTLTADGSPLPRSKKSAVADPPVSSFQLQSPTLTSSYLQEDGASFVTPAPPRVHPKLAPPSTAQRPSQHMPTSSPAPFWKYADIGSTPLKPLSGYEMSPSKTVLGIPPPSSSPPQPNKSPPSSPTRFQGGNSKPEQVAPIEEEEEDDEEEQGFDLTKGFQSIGAYHAPVGRGVSVANALMKGRT
ncbi:unnamed protein product [Clonostachys solani]|uniref:Uncharacterized protein n=1 Tax=Clonostachys solani TaxID=160281 RepID=A0A9N9W685_9HYPO|nr:unnamed protein product [Clonostachys solani]